MVAPEQPGSLCQHPCLHTAPVSGVPKDPEPMSAETPQHIEAKQAPLSQRRLAGRGWVRADALLSVSYLRGNQLPFLFGFGAVPDDALTYFWPCTQ